MRSVAVMLLLLASGMGAAIGTAADDAPRPLHVQADDPAGDARIWGGAALEEEARKICAKGPPQCTIEPGQFQAVEGIEAPPAFDIISMEILETPTHIEATLEVASLLPDLSGLVDDATGYGGRVAIAWSDPGSLFPDPCFGALYMDVYPRQGAYQVTSNWIFFGTDCDDGVVGVPCRGDGFGCNLEAPVEVEPGTPGRIKWTMPRDGTPGLAGGTTLASPFAATVRLGPFPDLFVRATTDGPRFAEVWWDLDSQVFVDALDFQPDAQLMLETQPSIPTRDELTWSWQDVPMPTAAAANPDVTLHESTWLETPTDLIIKQRFEFLNPDAPPQAMFFDFTLASGVHYYGGAAQAQGEYRSWFAEAWWQDGEAIHTPLPISMDVTTGRPGEITWTIERAVLAPIEAGSVGLGGWINQNPTDTVWANLGPAGWVGTYARLTPYVTLNAMPAYRFIYDSAPVEATVQAGILFEDAPDDAQVPTLNLNSANSNQYELLAVRAFMPDRETVRLEMDLADLTQVTVPQGYDAVFYAVGIEHARSDFMVGFYKEPGRGGDFFCSIDTTVMQNSPADPLAAPARTLIPGSVLPRGAASSEDGGRQVGGGTIAFDMPLECIGLESEESVTFTDRAAGVYWVQHFRDPTGRPIADSQIEQIDHAQADESELESLSAPPIAVVTPSFWQEPFGIAQFWDITGVVLALMVAVVSVAIFLRRRAVMKRYLVDLEDLADKYHNQPEAYGLSLVALRKRLYDDLLRNSLSESHFVMVEERLRSALSSTRINSFGAAFYDLPPALMIRLQSLLADGRFSPHDHKVLGELVEKLKIPASSRRDVRAQIALWAEQDNAMAKMAKLRKRERRKAARG